jgi:gas vesicle protein
MKIENIKKEVTHDMENLRKKSQTETQNTVEGYSSRLEQVVDRISALEHKIEIKGKTVSQTTQDLRKEYTRTHHSPTPSKDQK